MATKINLIVKTYEIVKKNIGFVLTLLIMILSVIGAYVDIKADVISIKDEQDLIRSENKENEDLRSIMIRVDERTERIPIIESRVLSIENTLRSKGQ